MNVLKYLAATKSMGLPWRKGNEGLAGFVDSDYAGDLDGRRSTSGFVFLSRGDSHQLGQQVAEACSFVYR